MTDHETYKQISKDKRRPKKPYRKEYGEKGSWDKARKKLGDKKLRVMQNQCVCSHTKYQHEFSEGLFGRCLHHSDCPCEHYEEFVDDEPNTEEQKEFLKNNDIQDIPF